MEKELLKVINEELLSLGINYEYGEYKGELKYPYAVGEYNEKDYQYETKEAAMVAGAIDHVAIDVSDVEAVYAWINEIGMNNTNDVINFLPFWENGFRFFKIEGPNKEVVEFGQIL